MAGLSELVTSTLRYRPKKVADAVSDNIPLLMRLRAKGRAKPVPAGRNIVMPVNFDEAPTQWYSGSEVLNLTPHQPLTGAVYDIKQLVAQVIWNGLERAQNRGRQAVIDMISNRLRNAENTMRNRLNDGLFGDGTANGGKVITGLAAQVSTNPSSGTVGGINRATASFWQNATEVISGTVSKTNIRPAMTSLMLKLTRGTDKVDLICFDDEFYEKFHEALDENQRFGETKKAMGGFEAVAWRGADVVAAGGIGGAIPAKRGYFLNTDTIKWCPIKGSNMVVKKTGVPVNQDSEVRRILFYGNLAANNLRLNGVLTDGG